MTMKVSSGWTEGDLEEFIAAVVVARGAVATFQSLISLMSTPVRDICWYSLLYARNR